MSFSPKDYSKLMKEIRWETGTRKPREDSKKKKDTLVSFSSPRALLLKQTLIKSVYRYKHRLTCIDSMYMC